MFKRIRKPLSVFLAVVMALSVLPFAVFAEEIKTASAAAETETQEVETHQGKLVGIELTVGNTKSTYASDENGKLVLVSEETVQKRGRSKAPKKSETPQDATGWESFSPGEIKDAAAWAIANPFGTAKSFDKDGKASVVYGIQGYGAFTDANHDLICDTCGFCLNGCTDGKTIWFTESDIFGEADADGKYYNAQGVHVGTQATGVYTYEMIDENGNPVYEEDGVTRKTETTEYSYIQFETYVEGADGVCDVCANEICNPAGHDYSDGFCDGCKSCMENHLDAVGATEDIPDGKCDECGFCMNGCVDTDADGVCDNCENTLHEHDYSGEGGTCTVCGLTETHECADVSGAIRDIPNGVCDNCGYCLGDCVDENGDSVCDNCGKPMLDSCVHSDLFGNEDCPKCEADSSCKHLTNVRLQQLSSQMSAMLTELKKRQEAGEEGVDADFIDNTLTPLLTAKDDGGSDTSLASAIAMRIEFSSANTSNKAFNAFCDNINALTLSDVTAQELVGTLKTDSDGRTVLDESGSLFTQAAEQLQQNEPVYEQTKAYIADYNTREAKIEQCIEKLTALVGELYDSKLVPVFGSSSPKYFAVSENQINALRTAMKAVDEALLYKLYGADWRTEAAENKAESIWNNKQTDPVYTSDASGNQERRAVGFILLSKIQFDINQFREAAFKTYNQNQIHYDSETGYYAKREATDDDILRDPDKDSDDYLVTDATIKNLITQIDGYLASPEAIELIVEILPDTFGIEIKNYDEDPALTMYDLLMSFLAQFLFSDEIINSLFALIFPTVTSLPSMLPDMLTNNDYIQSLGDGHYRIDVIKAITLLAGGSASTGETLSEVLDFLAIGGSFDFYVDGGNAKSLKTLLKDAGFSFWPKDVAALVRQEIEKGHDYAAIANALEHCDDNWQTLLNANDGKLNFEWNVKSFDDFKSILSIIFGAVSPVLEMLFAKKIEVKDKFDFTNAIYFSILVSLTLISIPAASDGGLVYYPDEFHFYQDIIAPIFEALGVNSFTPAGGGTVPRYTFRNIEFSASASTTTNVEKVVSGLLDPLFVLLQQFASHPLEKLFSILPNVMLMLENNKLFELLDIDTTFSAFIRTSFNLDSASDFFSGLGDIIEDQIMKHWYDWLNPVKYVQLVVTTAMYMIFQPVLGLVFAFMSLIDLEWLADMNLLDLSDPLNGVMEDTVFPMLPELFQMVAGLLGGKLKDSATSFDWPKNVKIESGELIGDLNFSVLFEKYFTSAQAVQALGFDFGKISTILEWFFGNLVDEEGNPIHLFDLDLLDLDELAHLGVLEKRSGSIREREYRKRWNGLDRDGEYYFVNADISDVFYYFVKLLSGVLTDKAAVKTIFSLTGIEYEDVKAALSKITKEQMDDLNLDLSGILKNDYFTDGNLDLDKVLANMTPDTLLVVMCEMLMPENDYPETLTYPEAKQSTKDDYAEFGNIPYLEYDNYWKKDIASFVTDDLDDYVNQLLKELPFDLDPETQEIETLQTFATAFLKQVLNKPEYLTLVVQLISGLYDDSLELPAKLLKIATSEGEETGVDITAWTKDFAGLFNGTAEESAQQAFPLLVGKRKDMAVDADGNPLVEWTYDGRPVETYADILEALGYLLKPLQPVFDMLFTDTDLRVLPYTAKGEPAGELVTVKGNRGYNNCLLPLLEAMGIGSYEGEDAVMTEAQFKALTTPAALLKCLRQVVDHLMNIIGSDTFLADLLEMLAQLMYAVSGNGVGAMLKNFLHPLWTLLDTLRPILNLDLDALVNTLLCRFTYQIGEYSSPETMQQIMKLRGVSFKLKGLSIDNLLTVISIIASVVKNGNRLYLDIDDPFYAAVDQLACLSEEYESQATEPDGSTRIARRLNTDGADALTAMLSMGVEILTYGENDEVLDTVIDRLLGQKGLVKTAIKLMNGLPAEYSSDFNWAYILGKDATEQEKIDLLAQIKEEGSVPAVAKRTTQAQKDFAKYLESYDMTNWDEDTAVYLAERLDDMIANALSIDTGGGKPLGALVLEKLGVNDTAQSYTLGSFITAAIHGLLTDEMINTGLGIVGDFLNGRDNPVFEKLAEKINPAHPEDALEMMQKVSGLLKQFNSSLCKATTVVGVDLKYFNVDATRTELRDDTYIYYDFNGEPTGLERPALKADLSNLGEEFYELTKPLQSLLAFLLLGKNLSLFNASGVTDQRSRRDDLINVTGVESYRYVLLPLLEALGCKDLKAASDYISGKDYDTDAFLHDLFNSVFGLVHRLLSDAEGKKVIDGLLNFVPELFYYINSNGLGVSLQNLTAQVTSILDFYNEYVGKTDTDGSTETTEDDGWTLTSLLKKFTDLDIDLSVVKLTDLFKLARVKDDQGEVQTLLLNDFLERLLDNFTVGKIYYNADSVCDFNTYRMTYLNGQDKAATITILVSFALDLLEDPANDAFWDTTVGEPVHRTLLNVLNLNEFKFDYQDPDWAFTEYADTDQLVTALALSKLFNTDPYAGKMWTREMAAELVDNIESFVNDMLYLLGLEIGGIKITDFRSLIHALIGGLLFSSDFMNRLTGLFGQIKPLLDKYDPDGAIAGFIKELLGIDVHAWDVYAPGGIYENGRDWGFSLDVTEEAVDANGAVFEKALVELLSPLAPAMAWVLADSDYTFFAEGDGLGENAEPIQLTLPGAEGYKYALVPLFEALNIDGSPKDLVQNLRDGDICDPAVYTANVKEDPSFAVTGVVHPLVAMLQKLMDSTLTRLLELFPSIVYFINSNGIDTVVKNLIHGILVIANAAEPLKAQIDQLVYDENGFDLYRTVNLEKLIREQLYKLIGVTEEDVKTIYEQCGGSWTAVDGLEDFDMRLLFSIALAAVNNFLAKNGLPFKFTSIAALAVNELTHGYVRSYDSLTGKTAYTMVTDKSLDKYCLGDLLSILIRIVLKFLSVDGNADALVALIKTKFEIHGVGEAAVCAFLHLLAGYMGTLGGFEVAMLSIYYTVYGASQASGSGVEAYDHVNDELTGVVEHLENLDNDIARGVMQALIGKADENFGDIIGSKGLAGNGLFRFFKQIFEWLMKIVNFFRTLFAGR